MKKLLIGLPILFVLLNNCTGKPNPYSVERDSELLKKWQKECNLNNYQSCSMLGTLYFRAEDYSTAKKYYEKACNGNYGSGCFSLGSLIYYGRVTEKDLCKANKYFIKGCNILKDKDNYCERYIRKTSLACKYPEYFDEK